MSQPAHKAKVHTPEAHAKISAAMSAKFAAEDPVMLANARKIRETNWPGVPSVAAKISATHKARGYKPVRAPGPSGSTLQQKILRDALGDGWVMEYVVTTGMGKPFHRRYIVDVANADRKIAIEVDGSSHNSPSAREKDARKTRCLEILGWDVIRFTNAAILDWRDRGFVNHVSQTLAIHGIYTKQGALFQ